MAGGRSEFPYTLIKEYEMHRIFTNGKKFVIFIVFDAKPRPKFTVSDEFLFVVVTGLILQGDPGFLLRGSVNLNLLGKR